LLKANKKGMMLQDLSWDEVKEYLSKKKDIALQRNKQESSYPSGLR